MPSSSLSAPGNSPRKLDQTCVLFAYHEMGFACMNQLIAIGAQISALFTYDDDPGEQVWWRSCAELARRNSIPVFKPPRIDEDSVAKVAGLAPSIIYSFNYRSLIPAAILNIPRLGAYNLHAAMLPKYRGRAPVNWMLANGEREAGVTLHHMVERADAGDIVAQRAIAIDDADTALTLWQKLAVLGAELIGEFHPQIAAATAPRSAQDLRRGSYFGRRGPEHGRIDWRWPARRIFNLVRAVTHPYPGAFCFCAGRKLYVWESALGHEAGRRGEPGQILGENSGAVEIAVGEGTVLLKRVQYEGDREDDASAVLRGDHIYRSRAVI